MPENITFDLTQPIPESEHWTDEAIDGLIGQRVSLRNAPISGNRMGTIIKAWRDGPRHVVMRVEPDRA